MLAEASGSGMTAWGSAASFAGISYALSMIFCMFAKTFVLPETGY